MNPRAEWNLCRATVAIALTLLSSCLSPAIAAEAAGRPTADISVMLSHGAVTWPTGRVRCAVDSLLFASSRVESILRAGGVLAIEKLFENFEPHDTLQVARTGEWVRVLDLSQVYLLHRMGGGPTDGLVRLLDEAPGVVFAERLGRTLLEAWYEPPAGDPMVQSDDQWGLYNRGFEEGRTRHADIDVKRAWQIETGSEDVVLGVIDTGAAYDHPDLSPDVWSPCLGSGCKVIGGRNEYRPTPDPLDPYDACQDPTVDGHGTKVTAIAAGLTNNTWDLSWPGGVAGVAGGWDFETGDDRLGASILAYRAIPGSTAIAARALQHAVEDGAHIINMSWSTRTPTEDFRVKTLWYVMINAFQLGIVQVASAGNAYIDPYTSEPEDPLVPVFPAAAEQGVIAVGASSYADRRITLEPQYEDYEWQSRIGPHIDVVAPGRAHFTADTVDGTCGEPPEYLWEFAGTSCAAPFVSGIAALLLSQNPYLSNEEVEGIICASAKDLVYQDPVHGTYAYPGWDEETGWGRVDAFQALMRLRSPYDLVIRSEMGYDTIERTGVVHTLGEPGERQRFTQWRLTKTIPFGGDYFTEPPDVWGLSRMSSGACSLLTFDDDGIAGDYGIAPELVMGYCKVVKGSVSETGFKVKTFCYRWEEEGYGGWELKGWIPTSQQLTTWHYELSGVVLDPAASSFEISAVTEAQDGVPCFCPAADADRLEVSLHLLDNLGRPLQGVPSTDIRILPIASPEANDPFRFVCPAEAESSHVFRSETFEESDENGDLVITLPLGGGGYDQGITWRVFVSGIEITADGPNQGVRSVDLNGDGTVGPVDFAIFAAGYGAQQWFADLNGDGQHTLIDLGILSAHYLHSCPAARGALAQVVETETKPTPVELKAAPNPSRGDTHIMFALSNPQESVTVRVYDLAGRLVRTLWDGPCDAGPRSLVWDGRNDSGNRVSSGVYFVRLEAPHVQRAEKLLLLK